MSEKSQDREEQRLTSFLNLLLATDSADDHPGKGSAPFGAAGASSLALTLGEVARLQNSVSSSLQITIALLVLPLVVAAYPASATTIAPDVYFTLRADFNAGPALLMDDTLFGFQGFITNDEGRQVDHTQWEFDMSLITGPVASATLDFTMIIASGSDTFFIDSYSADGIASLSDWLTASGSVASYLGTQSPVSIDITSLINASLAFTHIGFSFAVDPHPYQGFFNQARDPGTTLTFTLVPEPSTGALLLVGIAFAGLRRSRPNAQQ